MADSDKSTWGAYGLVIEGLIEPARFLVEVDRDWPRLRIIQRRPGSADVRPPALAVTDHRFDDSRSELWLSDTEHLSLVRGPTLELELVLGQEVGEDLLVHPYLALPAAVAGRWLDRQLLHGGAAVIGDRAWAVVGTKESGKSSTLGWLAAQGHPVLTDDLLVLDRGRIFAGPRSVDLRDDAAGLLGGEEVLVRTGRSRWRLRPGAVPPSIALGGFIHLEWGDDIAVERVEPAARLPLLLANCVFGPTVGDTTALLELASLPTMRFARPRDVTRLGDAASQLVDALD